MSFLEVIVVSLGLAMDAFAVALGIGTSGQAEALRPRFRIAFHFGLFQFLMPVIGWFVGSRIAWLISSWDHWLALGLLAFVGGRMIRSGLDPEPEPDPPDPTRGRTLVMLCIATSIDALAVGLSFALLGLGILAPSVTIGVITAGLSLTGLLLGCRLGETFGRRTEIVGGLVLIAIGLRVLYTHLLV